MTRLPENSTTRFVEPPALASGHDPAVGGRRGALRLAAAIAVGAAGFIAGQGLAHERGGPMGGMGPGMGMMGMGPGGFDPARAEAQIERMAKHLAVEADATPVQQEKLANIAKAAAKDLAATRQRMAEHRQQAMAVWSAPTIDKARLETLRTEQMKDAEAISRRITQALTDAAEVLSPEQRKKLAEHIAERRQHGPRGWGGWGGHD